MAAGGPRTWTGPISCRCTSATTSPTRTPSGPWPGNGLGIYVAGATDEAKEDRPTDADFKVADPEEAGKLLDSLAR